MVRITAVTPVEGFRVLLHFTDGTSKEVDLEYYLVGPIFEPIRSNLPYFQSVRVDPELGTIVWDNGADIDPDVLYHDRHPDRPQEVAQEAAS